MKVIITETASESLWPIYLYHLEYSSEYAESFQVEIDQFIVGSLEGSPSLGHLYHEPRGVRRLIFKKRYNIYYVVRHEAVFILFIFDGRMDINTQIKESGLDLDELLP